MNADKIPKQYKKACDAHIVTIYTEAGALMGIIGELMRNKITIKYKNISIVIEITEEDNDQ